MTKYDLLYKETLSKILFTGIEEKNIRTNLKTKSLPGITVQTDLEKDGFPLLSLRKMPMSFIPEIMWFLSGRKDIAWLKTHTKIWDAFADENELVSSAYGFRWRHYFDVDQISVVLDKLKNNTSDRQCVILMWDAKTDLTVKQKNVPCPFAFTVNIIGGRLNLHLIIRSNDMILGHPTDVAGFAFLMHIFAQELNMKVGILTVSISNAHIYENHYDIAMELLSRDSETTFVDFLLPKSSLEQASMLEDDFIESVKKQFKEYNPNTAIKNIPLAI